VVWGPGLGSLMRFRYCILLLRALHALFVMVNYHFRCYIFSASSNICYVDFFKLTLIICLI
jgi:hypothetical protein